MQQFSAVVRALRTWFSSIWWLKPILPYHLYFLFGGLAIIFLQELIFSFTTFYSYSAFYNLYYVFPLSFIGEYSFLFGVWMTLISKNVKLLSYGLWANAFLILFPFYSLSLYSILEAAIYALFGLYIFKFANSTYAKQLEERP